MVLNTIVDIMCTKAKGVGKINRVNTMSTIETISWSKILINVVSLNVGYYLKSLSFEILPKKEM